MFTRLVFTLLREYYTATRYSLWGFSVFIAKLTLASISLTYLFHQFQTPTFWEGIGLSIATAIGLIITITSRYKNILMFLQALSYLFRLTDDYLKAHPEVARTMHNQVMKDLKTIHSPILSQPAKPQRRYVA
jgi:hypothetical protein